MRGSPLWGETSPESGHIHRVTAFPHRQYVALFAGLLAISAAPAGMALARPGNARNGGGNGNRGGNPIITPPAVPTPPAPVRPGAPSAPRNPIGPPPGRGGRGGGDSPYSGSGAIPRGLATAGLVAGSGGAVAINYFIDLGHLPSAASHLVTMPAVLARLSGDSLGTITLRPLMTGRDANSTEAACALVAASQQHRAWIVAASLATARTTSDSDWLGTAALRNIGRRVPGMSVSRFVRGSTGRACYPQLTGVRDEARAAGVGSSPAYVVKGARGTRVVVSPASADDVMSPVSAVS